MQNNIDPKKGNIVNRILFILALLGGLGLQAQSALFLLISPVTTMNGMGEIGVGLPYEDQGAAYYNPANGFMNSPSLSVSESKLRTDWLPGLVDDMFLEHDHFRVSYRPTQSPFQFNLHQYETYLDAGEQQYTDASSTPLGTFKTWFKANALVFAGQYTGSIRDIPLELSYGIAYKRIVQHLTDGQGPNDLLGQAKNTVYDRGLLLGVPLKVKLKNDMMLNLKPSFGMSTLNIGDSVTFNPQEQYDPLPTVARVGIGLTASLPLNENWNLFEYSAGNAAMDVLEVPRPAGGDMTIRYQKGLGDIKLIKHVLMSEPDEDPERGHNVIITRGHELSLLDFYSIRFGNHVDLVGKVVTSQSGISYHSKGLLDLAYLITNIHLIDVINQHIDISYSYADWTAGDTHPLAGTKFESWNFTVKDIFGINNSLNSSSSPLGIKLKDILILSGGANFPRPIVSGAEASNQWQYSTGYTAGIETDLKHFRLGFSLTENRFAYDYDLFGGILRVDIKDELYQLGLHTLFKLELGGRLTFLGGPQVQSPLLHRKVTLWDQSIDDTNYEYNYGVRVGLEVKIIQHFALRGSYSYWHEELDSYFNEGEKVKLAGFQLEVLFKL